MRPMLDSNTWMDLSLPLEWCEVPLCLNGCALMAKKIILVSCRYEICHDVQHTYSQLATYTPIRLLNQMPLGSHHHYQKISVKSR